MRRTDEPMEPYPTSVARFVDAWLWPLMNRQRAFRAAMWLHRKGWIRTVQPPADATEPGK